MRYTDSTITHSTVLYTWIDIAMKLFCYAVSFVINPGYLISRSGPAYLITLPIYVWCSLIYPIEPKIRISHIHPNILLILTYI